MAMLMSGWANGGGWCSPPSQSRVFEQFIKLLKSIQARGDLIHLPHCLYQMSTEGEGGAPKEWEIGIEGGWVGELTKMWKNNQHHTTIGRHAVKAAFFFQSLPFISIPALHNWFLIRCVLSEVLLILPDNHMSGLHHRKTRCKTLRLPGFFTTTLACNTQYFFCWLINSKTNTCLWKLIFALIKVDKTL